MAARLSAPSGAAAVLRPSFTPRKARPGASDLTAISPTSSRRRKPDSDDGRTGDEGVAAPSIPPILELRPPVAPGLAAGPKSEISQDIGGLCLHWKTTWFSYCHACKRYPQAGQIRLHSPHHRRHGGRKGVDLRNLRNDSGYISYDRRLRQHGAPARAPHVHRWRGRHLALPRLIHRATGRALVFHRNGLPDYQTAIADAGPAQAVFTAADRERAHPFGHGASVRRFPGRRASHGHPLGHAKLARLLLPASGHNDHQRDLANFEETSAIINLQGRTMAAYAYRASVGLPYIYPRRDLPYCENFLHMMFSTPFEPFIALRRSPGPQSLPAAPRRPRARIVSHVHGAHGRVQRSEPVCLDRRRCLRPWVRFTAVPTWR